MPNTRKSRSPNVAPPQDSAKHLEHPHPARSTPHLQATPHDASAAPSLRISPGGSLRGADLPASDADDGVVAVPELPGEPGPRGRGGIR